MKRLAFGIAAVLALSLAACFPGDAAPARQKNLDDGRAVAHPTPTVAARPQAAATGAKPRVPRASAVTATATPRARTPNAPTSTPASQAREAAALTPTPTAPAGEPTMTAAHLPDRTLDGFIVVLPRTLRKDYRGGVSVSLMDGDRPASGRVSLSLLRGEALSYRVRANVDGSANLRLPLDDLAPGDYRVEVEVEGVPEKREARITVEDAALLMLETDKPIYKPGQTVRVRLLSLDASLKPRPVEAAIVVVDANGNTVFQAAVEADDFGMATVDVPLSTEPNLGTWKIEATAGGGETATEVRVEEYVLPRFAIEIETERGWALLDDAIRGAVSAEYFFGKPVEGEIEIVAARQTGGGWEEFARYAGPIDGEARFELPPVGHLDEGARRGSVRLEATVAEKGTGRVEKAAKQLTVTIAPLDLVLIPASPAFKPGLTTTLLAVTRTPDGSPIDADVSIEFSCRDFDGWLIECRGIRGRTSGGKAILEFVAPEGALSATLFANAAADVGKSWARLVLEASHSPSGVFIHARQVGDTGASAGDALRFSVASTGEPASFQYDVIAGGAVVLSGVSEAAGVEFVATQQMAPRSRLLVYRVLPNNDIVADYVPFSVRPAYPNEMEVTAGDGSARPGGAVDIGIRARGESRVGLVAVDTSVFALADNRLNLDEVFDRLDNVDEESLAEAYERHRERYVNTWGAEQIFEQAGAVVLTNKQVPTGESHYVGGLYRWSDVEALSGGGSPRRRTTPPPPLSLDAPEGAAASRVRQFFPETWIWRDVHTGSDGAAVVTVDAPDTITTWNLRAVGLSKEHGLGVAESSLRVFQPFFMKVDLPYSAIRGEALPVRVALYNYVDAEQSLSVALEEAGWFELLGEPSRYVTIGANDVAAVEFMIRPTRLGSGKLELTARSAQVADAVVKSLLVEPEGIEIEVVRNHVASDGFRVEFEHSLPAGAVEGSERAWVLLSGDFMAQPLEGLEDLLRMPYGCGEQNMVLFAPNVYVARYLRDTGRLEPDVLAKATELMLVGYQRQLTFRRSDGAFSAFGNDDPEGSLWLTAFVLKTFAEAREFIYVDRSVMDGAAAWIESHQRADGAFEDVGFLHDRSLLGGVQGRDALTAYVAAALIQAGRTAAAARAIGYLEQRLDEIDDRYTASITAYALALAGSVRGGDAHDALASMPADGGDGDNRSGAVESRAYELLAMLLYEDYDRAARAARWLVERRNAQGGFNSTQDTVVALQALAAQPTGSRARTDLVVALESAGWRKELRVTPENFDVLQMVDAPVGARITVEVRGAGTAVLQSVFRYNVHERQAPAAEAFDIDVDYGGDTAAVGERVTVTASIAYVPVSPLPSGMVVLEVAVPTGFEPVREAVEALVETNPVVRRFEIGDKKVVLYVDDMAPGDALSFEFQARAAHVVEAKAVVSRVYAYYRPEQRGETLAGAITVTR